MRRVSLKDIPLRTADPFAGWAVRFQWGFFTFFLFSLILVCLGLWPGITTFSDARWPDGLLVTFGAAALLAGMTRQLPGQNVILAACVIAGISVIIITLGVKSGVPFGPFTFTSNIGPHLFNPLPWAIPVVWVIAILTSRGVARLILRPWRKTKNYGFWLIGFTVALVIVFDFSLEPYVTQVRHFWLWNPTKAGLTWYHAPWVNFLGWAVTTLLILAFVTPALINKKPVKRPPEFFPLVMWLMLLFLFAIGCLTRGLFTGAIAITILALIAAVAAIRGGTW